MWHRKCHISAGRDYCRRRGWFRASCHGDCRTRGLSERTTRRGAPEGVVRAEEVRGRAKSERALALGGGHGVTGGPGAVSGLGGGRPVRRSGLVLVEARSSRRHQILGGIRRGEPHHSRAGLRRRRSVLPVDALRERAGHPGTHRGRHGRRIVRGTERGVPGRLLRHHPGGCAARPRSVVVPDRLPEADRHGAGMPAAPSGQPSDHGAHGDLSHQ